MRRRNQAGYTLLELAIGVSLLGLITGSIVMVSQSTQSAYGAGTEGERLEASARRAMDRICDRIQASSSANATPQGVAPFFNEFVDYQPAIGFQAPDIVWGNPERIILEYDPDDGDDGIDNDGDGLIDEGQVVWIENFGLADERRHVLCRDVREYLEGEIFNGADDNANGLLDERGLSIDFDGETVSVRLTLEHLDSEHMSFTRTVERTVAFRNTED